jgi:hypothetical protein
VLPQVDPKNISVGQTINSETFLIDNIDGKNASPGMQNCVKPRNQIRLAWMSRRSISPSFGSEHQEQL